MADAAAPSKRLGDMRELAGIEVTQLAPLDCALGFSKEAKRACTVRQERPQRLVIGMDRQITSTFVNMIRRLVMRLKSLILKEKTTKGIHAKEDPAQGRVPAIITYLRHNSERSDIAKNQITSTFVNFTWPHDLPALRRSILLETNNAETRGVVKIALGEGRPRAPVGMGSIIAALVEIGTPFLSAHLSKGADVCLEEGEGQRKSQVPDDRVAYFGLDALGQVVVQEDLREFFEGEGRASLHATFDSHRIVDV